MCVRWQGTRVTKRETKCSWNPRWEWNPCFWGIQTPGLRSQQPTPSSKQMVTYVGQEYRSPATRHPIGDRDSERPVVSAPPSDPATCHRVDHQSLPNFSSTPRRWFVCMCVCGCCVHGVSFPNQDNHHSLVVVENIVLLVVAVVVIISSAGASCVTNSQTMSFSQVDPFSHEKGNVPRERDMRERGRHAWKMGKRSMAYLSEGERARREAA